MRVSVGLPTEDWRACGDAARQAEDDGADAVTSSELKHDPFAPLAFAALATQRVSLVTSVAIAFPRSPMVVANQAWDLHSHPQGRFVLGSGSQIKAHNERRFSMPWIAPARTAGRILRGAAGNLSLLGDGEKLNFRGKYYNFSLMTPEFCRRAAAEAAAAADRHGRGRSADAEDRRRGRRQRPPARFLRPVTTSNRSCARCWRTTRRGRQVVREFRDHRRRFRRHRRRMRPR